jgi:tRNA-(ms[2]io[6]A)-hydroxylase
MTLPDIHEFLGCRTPDAWVQAALADQETMLIDHKNCEKKSAMQLRIVRNTHAA